MTRYLALALLATGCIPGQETAEKVVIPFSDPSRPKQVRIDLLHGSMTVRGYEGKDVVIEGRGRTSKKPETTSDGLRRIPMNMAGLQAEEENNVIRINTGGRHREVDLVIQVPRATSLQLRSVNSDKVEVDGIEGEVEVNNTNGDVRVTNVAGTVVATSTNGDIKVTFDRVRADRPMSFSTLNGDVDVTFPADVKANLKLKSDHGDVFTDFEVQMSASPRAVVQENSSGRGKFRVAVEKTVYASINGGGPEMSFTTMNGQINIRKKK